MLQIVFPKREKKKNTEMGKGVRSKPWCSFIKIFFKPIRVSGDCTVFGDFVQFEVIVQFLIKYYPSELFIKLQETANSGEQIFLMSSSPAGPFWCHPLFPSADILGSLWLWLPICLKRQPSHQRKAKDRKKASSQDVPPSPCPLCHLTQSARLLKRDCCCYLVAKSCPTLLWPHEL